MSIRGRAFLDVARELAQGATEAHWRSAAGRAYYALFLEALAALPRWGFSVPPHHQVHAFVRLRFTFARDPDLKEIGYALDDLIQLRNEADYKTTMTGAFADPTEAMRAVDRADVNIRRLDQVEADAPRLAAAIAGIRAQFP